MQIEMDSHKTTVEIEIPKELVTSNLVIEGCTNGGIKKSKIYYSASLKVRVMENLGLLKVQNNDDVPLPETYVKVYSMKGSKVAFFKDGYTDMRGRFDYGQLSGVDIKDVDKFSILVMNKEFGSLVKEARSIGGGGK